MRQELKRRGTGEWALLLAFLILLMAAFFEHLIQPHWLRPHWFR
jgi:hypothetical protein